jgi:hypothetical protein
VNKERRIVHERWRVRELLSSIAILAIWLAALRYVASPSTSDDLQHTYIQVIAMILAFLVIPLHLMLNWARSRS